MSPELLAILVQWLATATSHTYQDLLDVLPEREKFRAFLIQQELKQRGLVQPRIRFENGRVVHELLTIPQNGEGTDNQNPQPVNPQPVNPFPINPNDGQV